MRKGKKMIKLQTKREETQVPTYNGQQTGIIA